MHQETTNKFLIGQDDFPFWISGFLSSCGEGGLFCSNGKDPVVGDSDLVRIPAKILYRVAESIEGLFDVWTPVLLVKRIPEGRPFIRVSEFQTGLGESQLVIRMELVEVGEKFSLKLVPEHIDRNEESLF